MIGHRPINKQSARKPNDEHIQIGHTHRKSEKADKLKIEKEMKLRRDENTENIELENVVCANRMSMRLLWRQNDDLNFFFFGRI